MVLALVHPLTKLRKARREQEKCSEFGCERPLDKPEDFRCPHHKAKHAARMKKARDKRKEASA